MQRLTGWLSQLIEPDLPVEAPRVDHKRVTFPFACGVTVPRWSDIRVRHKLTAVHENLPPEIERFMYEVNPFRCLDHSPRRRGKQNFRNALRQAIRIRFLSPVQSRGAFVVN